MLQSKKIASRPEQAAFVAWIEFLKILHLDKLANRKPTHELVTVTRYVNMDSSSLHRLWYDHRHDASAPKSNLPETDVEEVVVPTGTPENPGPGLRLLQLVTRQNTGDRTRDTDELKELPRIMYLILRLRGQSKIRMAARPPLEAPNKYRLQNLDDLILRGITFLGTEPTELIQSILRNHYPTPKEIKKT